MVYFKRTPPSAVRIDPWRIKQGPQGYPGMTSEEVQAIRDSAATSADAAQQAAADAAAAKVAQDSGVAAIVGDTTTTTNAVLAGQFTPKVHYLDPYNDFFNGDGDVFVTGQRTTPTTTTAAVAGGTVLPLADATGVTAGVVLVVNRGTPQQQVVRVTSVTGSDATVTPALAGPVASGATVSPAWVNEAHLTTDGYDAFAYWIAQSSALDLADDATVTFLGNSWIDNRTEYVTRLNERFPSAVGVEAGVAGNTSTALVARFDTDVPTGTDYVVINEPGVNDTLYATNAFDVAQNLSTLIQKIHALGATAVVVGPVPLVGFAARAMLRAVQVRELVAPTGAGQLATLMDGWGADNTGFGPTAMGSLTSGEQNTAYGSQSLRNVTTGVGNTGVGYRALRGATGAIGATAMGVQSCQALTTATGAVGVGYQTMFSLTSGSDNTAVGAQAGFALTTAAKNTFIGRYAGYVAGGSTANATTTATGQTVIGERAGQSTATQVDDITVVGREATAGAVGAVAVGRSATADHVDSVALGSGTTTTADGQVMVGPRDVEVTDATKGIVLQSPDGTRYRITVANGGALSATAVV